MTILPVQKSSRRGNPSAAVFLSLRFPDHMKHSDLLEWN